MRIAGTAPAITMASPKVTRSCSAKVCWIEVSMSENSRLNPRLEFVTPAMIPRRRIVMSQSARDASVSPHATWDGPCASTMRRRGLVEVASPRFHPATQNVLRVSNSPGRYERKREKRRFESIGARLRSPGPFSRRSNTIPILDEPRVEGKKERTGRRLVEERARSGSKVAKTTPSARLLKRRCTSPAWTTSIDSSTRSRMAA